jgi:NADPH:quinone reductase
VRAIQVQRLGGPEVLTVRDVPEPQPGSGEVRVRVAAAGVNFIDVYFRTGMYPVDPPFIAGREASGTVDAVGEGVDTVAPGDRVAFALVPGAFAEAVCVPADRVAPVPDGVEFDAATALMLQGATAHFLTTSTFLVEPGHRVLLHAAAGGVGQLLTQLCKLRGAIVFATVGSQAKETIARQAGADEVIRYDQEDFAGAIAERAGVGMDVVYDGVGKETFDRGLTCLRPRGFMVLYGQSSGPVPPIDPQRLNREGSLYLTRPNLAHYIATREELLSRMSDVFKWAQEGALKPLIGGAHPLEEAPEVFRRLESRKTSGKLLLLP